MPEPERIRLSAADPVLARSQGGDRRHRVVRVRRDGADVIVKLYGLKRSRLRSYARSLGHRLLLGKTTLGAAVRQRSERQALELWGRHGFAVPRLLEVQLEPAPEQPYLVMEYVAGPSLKQLLHDPKVETARAAERLACFALDWCRRHDTALSLREPGLLHTHGSFDHVIDTGSRLVCIDHEYAYTDPRRIELGIGHEIVGFASSLLRAGRSDSAALLGALVRAYPNRARLERAVADMERGRVAIPGWLRPLAALLAARGATRRRDATLAALRGALQS